MFQNRKKSSIQAMSMRVFTASLYVVGLICLFGTHTISAKNMYKWVDEHGNIYFSDQVPPEHIGYRRESLNQKGRVLEVTQAKEQEAQERQLQALRKAQEKIIAAQESHDKVLLSTFRNLEDMQAAQENSLKNLEIQKSVIESNLKRLENQLKAQQKQAAAHERDGKKLPQRLLDGIQSTQAQIRLTQTEIGKQSEKIQQAKAAAAADVERYKLLTQSDAGASAANANTAQDKASELGLFRCGSEAQCAKAWAIAHDFINKHASTGTDVDTDKLIMSLPPVQDNDLSLSITRIDGGKGKQQLFLDIRCRESLLGAELCASQKVRDIRSAFRPYIESALASD
jgi:uncharacterized protein DUF4124